jgi:hypothetical protein
MSYYDQSKWLDNQEKESKRRLQEQQEKWLKEQKKIVLVEIKRLKGNPGELNKVYTKKEIAASKKAELKEAMKEFMEMQNEEIKEDKRQTDFAIKQYKDSIAEIKERHAKTKKRLSKITKGDLDFIKEELNEKWEKQWGKSQNRGTRKK